MTDINIQNPDKSINTTPLLIESDILIGDICLTSYPCQHYVEIKGIPKGNMWATDIYKIYSSNNLQIPKHFAYVPTIKKTAPITDTKLALMTETKLVPLTDTKLVPLPDTKLVPLSDTKLDPLPDIKLVPDEDKKTDDDILLTKFGIKIGKTCYHTYPCQHNVTINGIKKGLMYANDISNFYSSNNLQIPEHFDYRDYLPKISDNIVEPISKLDTEKPLDATEIMPDSESLVNKSHVNIYKFSNNSFSWKTYLFLFISVLLLLLLIYYFYKY
jgi:hypothetical protein